MMANDFLKCQSFGFWLLSSLGSVTNASPSLGQCEVYEESSWETFPGKTHNGSFA